MVAGKYLENHLKMTLQADRPKPVGIIREQTSFRIDEIDRSFGVLPSLLKVVPWIYLSDLLLESGIVNDRIPIFCESNQDDQMP